MKHSFIRIILFSLFLIGTMQGVAQNKKSGNPILPGFHADPEVLYSQNVIIFILPAMVFRDGAEVILRSFHRRI